MLFCKLNFTVFFYKLYSFFYSKNKYFIIIFLIKKYILQYYIVMNKFMQFENDENTDEFFNTYIKGEILASDGSNFTSLPPGLNGRLLTCNSNSIVGVEWTSPALVGGGGLTYLGVWNALTNQPDLLANDGIGGPYSQGDYFIINIAGSTLLNGISNWGLSDWVIRSSDDTWHKIDNSEQVGLTRHSELTEIGTISHDLIDTHILNNSIHFEINDVTPSNSQTYSSTKIETSLGTKTSINDVTPSNSQTYSSNKIETALGTKTSINDVTPSNSQTYSSNKIETALSGKASSTHNHSINTLSNVSISTPVSGDNLRWDGISSWVNSQRQFSSVGTGTSVIKSATYDIIYKTLKATVNSIVLTDNLDDLTFNVPKITSNSIQVSNEITGWKLTDSGSLNFVQNGATKFVIPSNSSFLAGFNSGSNTAGLLLPVGNTSQRANTNGAIRYNSTTLKFEYYNGSWISPSENTTFASLNGTDLSINGAIADQILGYTGTVWAPRYQSTLGSLGTGVAVLKNTVLNGLSTFRSFKAGTNTTVALVGDDIEISATSGGGGEANTAIGLGNGVSVVGAKVGTVLGFKNIIQGTGIAITNDAIDITIASTGGGEVNTVSNLGTGQGIFKQKTGVNFELKSLVAGTNITLDASNTNQLTINATGGGGSTTISVDPACPFLSAFLVGSNYTISTRASETIRLGLNAGGVSGTQNNGGISIGDNTAKTSGVENCVLGGSAMGGTSNTKNSACVFGILAGYNNCGNRSTCMGFQSGFNNMADDAIAIGPYAGYSGTQPYTVSIGNRANFTAPASACIVINATSVALNGSAAGLFINPVRGDVQTSNLLTYNTSTKEISYNNTGKTFIIQHPINDNKLLVHACIEGPELGVYYRGTNEIVNNFVEITLPSYCINWYDYTIQLTAKNSPNPNLYCSDVTNCQFIVYGDPGFFNWHVTAKRGELDVEPLKSCSTMCGQGPYTYIEPVI